MSVTPTLTHYEQVASEFMSALDKVLDLVPQLEMVHQSTAEFVHGRLNIPIEFLKTTIVAVEQEAELKALNKLDTAEGRDALQFFEAFRPVLDKLRVVRRTLKFTLDAKYANLAEDSLQVFAIAKGIARDPGSASVAAHVENMSRDLDRRRPQKRAPAAAAKQEAA